MLTRLRGTWEAGRSVRPNITTITDTSVHPPRARPLCVAALELRARRFSLPSLLSDRGG